MLDLGGNQIGAEGARALASLSALTSLYLGGNQIGAEGARALASLSTLTLLDLGGNQIGDDGAQALALLSALTSLHLGGNQIGDEGARALASLSALTSLYLGGNQIGDDGAQALALLSALTSLDLSGNQIGAEGARALASLLALTSLHLGGNQIGDAGARALASLSALTSLHLNGNQIGAEGARALVSLSALTSLGLSSNQIGARGARALASLSALTSLDLRNNQIGAEGARVLASLTALTSLNLSDNKIGDEGAGALASLSALTSLGLGSNQIGAQGARALASLSALTSLDLYDNQIAAQGARASASLTALTSLHLYRNQIGADGARALASLSTLTFLDLDANQIGDEGALALASLSALTRLDVRLNQIGDEGARALASLSALTSLDLFNNQIGYEGARALASLSTLTSLDLASNQIGAEGARALLEAWSDRPTAGNLIRLNLRGSGDLSSVLPAGALDATDAQSILAAYRRYRSAAEQKTLRPLNEAKLLVVGEEDVGKTSLIRYLVDNAPRNDSEPKTARTAIHEQINTQAWLTGEGGVTLNIWDFGGQEIMRGTHRFFLTARSLYLLVLEDRRQDDRSVYDWLKTIRNRGDQSPVIVVINKSDEGKQDLLLDKSALQRDYPSIVSFVRTCCDPGELAAASIQKLREVIAETLENDERLQHVRDPIPEPWLRVKSAVAKMAREQKVLERKHFEGLCEKSDSEAGGMNTAISNSDEQRALLRLLHDLGVVVAHGLERDAPSANREITLLDPNWLTGAIYTLLNSPTVRDQAGEFGRAQMGDLLDAKLYPKHWHEFILGMMQDAEVGLCFELPGSDPRTLLGSRSAACKRAGLRRRLALNRAPFSLPVRLSPAGSDPAFHRADSPQPDQETNALADGGVARSGGLQSAGARGPRPPPH